MKKLKWIQIENFRGIKKAELQGFGDVNVFIGKNNTGKSTVLEAIYLNLTNGNLDLLNRMPLRFLFYRRGIEPREFYKQNISTHESVSYMLNYLFNGFSNQNYLRVHSNIAEYELLLKDAHEMPPEVLENYISGYQAATKLVKKLVEAFYEEQKEKDEKFLEILEQMASRLLIPRFVLMTSEGKIVMIIIESTYKEVVEYKIFFPPFEQTGEHANVVLIDEYLTRGYLGSTTDFSTILKNLDRTFKPKLESVKEFLGRQFPIEIQDIVSTLSDFYVITEDKIAIPISLVGDGTKTSLIYFYVLSSEGNYILLEEPENHLHPRLMKNVIDIILEASKHNNQIFITTHSLEFLENLLEMAAQKGANLMTFRFEKLDNGIPVIESYDLTEANKAVNKIGVDIR